MTLDDLQKLCDAATPGPWANGAGGTLYKPCAVPAMTDVETGKTVHRVVEERVEADAAFIAAARTYLPRLIAVARAARSLDRCLGEFSEPTDKGCAACHEYGAALDDALAALEAP